MGAGQKKSQKEKLKLIQEQFDQALLSFNHRGFLHTDPLQIPHRYSSREDQELTGLVAALFSFGNVRSILKTLEGVLGPLGPAPVKTLTSMRAVDIKKMYSGTYYRFFSSADITTLFEILRRVYSESSTGLEGLIPANKNHLERLFEFRSKLLRNHKVSPGLKFMFPDPLTGAAKRWHMFLRWMVRKDDVDLGIWTSISAADLVVPLDTHIFEICRGVGLTARNQPGLKTALELTETFKAWAPEDPLRYDFAICRLGILKQKREFLANFKVLSRAL